MKNLSLWCRFYTVCPVAQFCFVAHIQFCLPLAHFHVQLTMPEKSQSVCLGYIHTEKYLIHIRFIYSFSHMKEAGIRSENIPCHMFVFQLTCPCYRSNLCQLRGKMELGHLYNMYNLRFQFHSIKSALNDMPELLYAARI